MATAQNRGRMAELLWLRAHVLELQGHIREADATLAQAEDVSGEIRDRLCGLQILAQRLLLRHEHPEEALGDDVRLRDKVAQLLECTPEDDLAREQTLTQVAAALAGPAYRTALLRAAGVGGGTLDATARKTLVEALNAAASADSLAAAVATDMRAEAALVPRAAFELKGAAGAAVAAAFLEIYRKDMHSISAANLAGLDDYRESWETETPLEAV
jgi:hypothetical protein